MSYINNEVYSIVNDIAKQALGSAAVTVVDTASFVDLGNNVLNSNDSAETFMSTLLLRLARTYFTWRPYESSLRDLMVTGAEWGAIYQKIDGAVGDFVSDETYSLEDGKSVDMYIVRKPTAKQKLFIRRSPYQNFITISRQLLKGAFKSEQEFANFVSMIYGKMRIKLDFATENLARLAIANYIGLLSTIGKTEQVRHLLTEYNAESGQTLTKAQAYLDKDFLAFAAGEMELASKRLRSLSTAYNVEGDERHTPQREQRFLVFDKFQSRLQHVLQYQAFHEELVRLREFVEVPYWQGEQTRDAIKVEVEAADGESATTTVEATDICGMIFDRYALGTFRSEDETLTTPVNARARYYNVFHFAEQLWYNDLSENAVVFMIN